MLLTVAGLLALAGCGSTQDLSSAWSSNAVTIDGDASDWGSGLANLKDTKVYLGVRNDGDYLYLCLNSQDQQFRRQMIGLGLTVWFEPKGGDRLGILFPIGILKEGGRSAFEGGESQDPEDREQIGQQALRDFEVLGPGKDDRNLFSVVQSPGISMKVGGRKGQTVYELRVPLKKSSEHPYAIGADPGSTVGIEIETGKFEGGSRPGGMGEGMRGGRRPRGGEGMGGEGMPGEGMSGTREGRERQPRGTRPEPLDVSVTVHLAGPASGDSGH
jgi:hypothetical protein